ncbi:MAG: S41 family peptidase [Acidobacteria bacterium]|nr:S41 family peptidase [Acidobacteriota bacterium]MCA1640668.1 S41 family peptidase [Acidobacteriota bacterium]
MNNRLSRSTLALLSLALTVSFVSAQQTAPPRRGEARTTPNATTPPASRGARDRARNSPNATSALEEDFAEALSIVQDNYVDGVKLEYNTVFKSSIIGMLRSLDPHSNYYDAKEFEELQTDWRSEYYGVGASINNYELNGTTETYVLGTFENSPAAKAGLRYGDKILAVDGKEAKGKPSAEVRDWIRGPKGSTVKMTLERAATGAKETVEITRAVVPQPTVPDAYMIKPGVGYIDMQRGFNRTTADEFVARLEQLHKQGMTQLVIDLRNNPGGLLDQAVKVAERFLARGQLILSQRGRIEGTDRSYNSTNNNPNPIPLVVLVNRNTASASEIVAGALQDHDRALVVGETSFGKGLVQSIIPMDYGTALTLTSTKYYTPSGRLIQRDYSNEGLYDYYTKGQGVGGGGSAAAQKPTGPESLTDTGRKVYGGGGISPDDAVKPRLITPAQRRLRDPIFGFVRELVNGRPKGFEDYKVGRAIEFDHVVKADEYPVTDNLFKAFKAYALADTSNNLTDAQLDKAREFITRQLRFEITTAAYGTVAAAQVLVATDPEISKAIDVLPRARELALAAQRGRNPQTKSFE